MCFPALHVNGVENLSRNVPLVKYPHNMFLLDIISTLLLYCFLGVMAVIHSTIE